MALKRGTLSALRHLSGTMAERLGGEHVSLSRGFASRAAGDAAVWWKSLIAPVGVGSTQTPSKWPAALGFAAAGIAGSSITSLVLADSGGDISKPSG